MSGITVICPECGDLAVAEDYIDVGVGFYIKEPHYCKCGWNSWADGLMNVDSYDDYFLQEETSGNAGPSPSHGA